MTRELDMNTEITLMHPKNPSFLLATFLILCCFTLGQAQAEPPVTDPAAALVQQLIGNGMDPAAAVTQALTEYPGAYASVVAAALGAVDEQFYHGIITTAFQFANKENRGSEVLEGVVAAGLDPSEYLQYLAGTAAGGAGSPGSPGVGNTAGTPGGGGGGRPASPS